jgi:tetratricopeptide (TPR) repeat protein
MIRKFLLLAFVIPLLLALPQPAFADRDDEECYQGTLDETGERSIKVCSRILARGKVRDRDLARTYNNRGLAYITDKELDKAMADFDAAVRIDPTYPFAYDNRGVVWRMRSQFDRAIVEHNEAIRREPTFISAYVNRGMAFQLMGNKRSAKADFDAVLGMQGRDRPIDKWAKETAEIELKKLGPVD